MFAHFRFWHEPIPYTPESRVAVHKHMAAKRQEKAKEPE